MRLLSHLEESSEQLRYKLTAVEAEKKKMAAEIGKVNKENEEHVLRLEELRARLADEGLAHATEREKLQKRFDGEYAVFLERRAEFNESMRMRCVFCPQENQVPLASFLFHVAREHMFDQARRCSSSTSEVNIFLRAFSYSIFCRKSHSTFSTENNY